MGRPREHDDETRAALLAAAEKLLAGSDAETLSIRRLAAAAGTSTRAVYSVFGGKAGLASALYQQTFETLGDYILEAPQTDDPRQDLVAAGLRAFRRYALEHPSLFRLVFERVVVGLETGPEAAASGLEALGHLRRRVERLAKEGVLGDRSIGVVTLQFHALCQGLASLELRGWLDHADPEVVWEQALETFTAGLDSAPTQRRSRASSTRKSPARARRS